LLVFGACGDESDPADAVTPDPTTAVAAVESTPGASSTATPTTAAAAVTTTVGGPSSTFGVPPLPGPPAPPIGDEVPIVTEPAPDEMCDQGSVPQAAAYGFDNGTLRWVSCTDELAWRTVRAVTDDAVYIVTESQAVTALDPSSGDVLGEAPPPPPENDPGHPPVIEVDGVRVRGEQGTGVSVTGANGVELWTRPGGWVYGDVWAIDDGAVFAVENHSDLVAYDLHSGDVRWAHRGDPYAEGLWPWHAEGQRIYSMWGNLQVRSTVDGAVIWATDYPWQGAPTGSVRMSGVGIDDESVFVAFASASSGGD
jgi:outer membrane protein assembly factor BamB